LQFQRRNRHNGFVPRTPRTRDSDNPPKSTTFCDRIGHEFGAISSDTSAQAIDVSEQEVLEALVQLRWRFSQKS
jgi:hypothetical protein